MLRHSNLKKVARLPCKDRREVLNFLKKNVWGRSERTSVSRSCEVKHHGTPKVFSSSASVNNVWKHWVVMHGNEKLAADDVRGIGRVIGLNLKSDNANIFSALARAKKGKHVSSDAVRGEFYLANVYAPCDLREKQALWDSLSGRIQSLHGTRVCVCGDFNAVRSIEERRSAREGPRSSVNVPFNRFIDDSALVDLPLSGRKFTWYKGDGLSMSRLDRFLLSRSGVYLGPIVYRINSLKIRLSALEGKGEDEALSEVEVVEVHEISSVIHSLSKLNASISWQQSRSLWLKEGDANSKYFHSIMANRRRGNAISLIHVEGGTLEGVQPIRGSLIKPFSVEEVKEAVWDCDCYKSLGPDGINFRFIRDFWPELQADIMRFIVEFHRNGKLSKGLNSTFIALIPKVLANRLRQVIGSVVSKSLTAFIKGRQILDGILIANEVVDEARRTKKELLLFKVDFEKAYDSVDWGYLDAVMGKMSFPVLWRKWIKECVCTATASVLVNGSQTDEFPLERGLRQGDPLSPFLFLLAAEGLNVLMQAMVENNIFSGYNVRMQNTVSVSHLQFADDTLLLGTKSWANVRALRAVLVLFETMSGLKMNFNKSMLVRANISVSWLQAPASALRCRVGNIPFLYLGLPIGGDQRRLSFWKPVLTRIRNRLSGWKSRFLSFGGRLILLKSVLTSLLVYALSFFKAPSGTISSIDSLLSKFFWVGSEDFRKTSWISWSTICLRKEYGGLGVRRLREFNIALLGKWCWRMLVDRGGLWFRLLAARYGLEIGRLRAGGRSGSSWWREIVRIRDGAGGIGGGWFGDYVQRKVQSSDVWQWRPDPIQGYSVRGVYQLLTSHPLVGEDVFDDLIWHRHVPLKVSILAWRLLCDRLPTRVNLASRGIITLDVQSCVAGCADIESAQHLFISCGTFGSLWSSVRSWLGVHSVDPHSVADHFLQFTFSAGGLRARFLQLIWLLCVG
ncbi:hypothetical protein TSUD_146580 [Trifolium subterraneum]|uniref:Reverse transcriptase domain-containing protein n=1 Tax=Trifolium subterraneum TaxID=3900 RepID=A0A2Z6MDB8_TRISU|nr:hypothetical protein TSUD_146580 [Trifolium subterraneum]